MGEPWLFRKTKGIKYSANTAHHTKVMLIAEKILDLLAYAEDNWGPIDLKTLKISVDDGYTENGLNITLEAWGDEK